MFWALAEKGLAGKRIGVCFDIALWNGRRRDGAWREEVRLVAMRKLKKYRPTKFRARGSVYDKAAADYAVSFIECLCHTKGDLSGEAF